MFAGIRISATTAIAAVCVFVYALQALATGGLAPHPGWLEFGAVVSPFAWERVHSLITSAYLHAGVLHLAMNMFALVSFGHGIAWRLGEFNTALVFHAAAVSGAAACAFFATPGTATVGASGGICGLIGAGAACAWLDGRRDLFREYAMPGAFALALPLLINAISFWGHAGGLLGGLLLGAALHRRLRLRLRRRGF